MSSTAGHYVTLWYEAAAAGGTAVVAAPDEVSEVGWFAPDALPEPLFPPLRRLLEGDVL